MENGTEARLQGNGLGLFGVGLLENPSHPLTEPDGEAGPGTHCSNTFRGSLWRLPYWCTGGQELLAFPFAPTPLFLLHDVKAKHQMDQSQESSQVEKKKRNNVAKVRCEANQEGPHCNSGYVAKVPGLKPTKRGRCEGSWFEAKQEGPRCNSCYVAKVAGLKPTKRGPVATIATLRRYLF